MGGLAAALWLVSFSGANEEPAVIVIALVAVGQEAIVNLIVTEELVPLLGVFDNVKAYFSEVAIAKLAGLFNDSVHLLLGELLHFYSLSGLLPVDV